jgi:acetolactate decarboxylase
MQADRDTLFQTSTLSALQAGDYDGILTIGALKQHGDFGLGSFNTLDGEMGFEMIPPDPPLWQPRNKTRPF